MRDGARLRGMRSALLDWYGPRRSAYPWRTRPPDPYRVLVSEVMLQQTQAARVAPAFVAFVRRFPSVESLAAAPTADVLRVWSGLGYNRRAVALHEAARAIVRDHEGGVPNDPAVLVGLPGVGPYTAAAIASLGFGVPVPALDTNARRVVARAMLGCEPADADPRHLARAATQWMDGADPGAWNQAVMDLGRTFCGPRTRCASCPLRSGCRFAGRPGASLAEPKQPFEGSARQVRGAVVRVLIQRSPVSLAQVARTTGFPIERLAVAATALSRDGLIGATPAAMAGKPNGRVRLPD